MSGDDHGLDSQPRTWSADAFMGDPQATLRACEAALPVKLIATERKDFKTCSPGDALETVQFQNRRGKFDFLPVLADGRIVGLLDARRCENAMPGSLVADVLTRLSEENLIGADASILSFVRDADRHRIRLLVAGREISGLVSLADLQRLPVRSALFALVTGLEITMTEAIERQLGKADDAWMQLLSEDRQTQTRKKIAAATKNDTLIKSLLFTEFGDKVTILMKSRGRNGSRSKFKTSLGRIERLRNGLAHAADYADTDEKAAGVCAMVRDIDKWIDEFSQWPAKPPAERIEG